MSDRELRDLLENTQAELDRAKKRLAELEEQSTETLQERIKQFEEGAVMMRARLEQGDTVRESWANKQASLERELLIARTEQQRLQSQLETIALERKLGARPPGKLLENPAMAAGAGALVGLGVMGLLLLWVLMLVGG
jgi:hypothetical protein